MNTEKRLSADGSFTLYNLDYQESYHSLKDGAINETMQKHILPPILFSSTLSKPKIKILDICFGLGYNSFLSIFYYLQMGYCGEIEVYSPEKDQGLFEKLLEFDYPQEIQKLNEEKISTILLELLHKRSFSKNNWKISLYFGDALSYLDHFEKETFDVIYQDAFSPLKNPELWSKEYFLRLKELLKEDGLITTYCQKGSIKEIVKECGLYVYDIKNQEIRNSRIFSKKALNFENLKEK